MTRSLSKGLARAVLSMVRGRNTGCAGSQITRGAQGGSAGGIRDNARRCVLLNGLAPAWRSLSNSKLLVPVPISHSRAGRLSSLAWRSANELTPRCYLGPASQCDSAHALALMPSSPRRFPPPWSAEVQPNYYVVRDADGQQLAHVYYLVFVFLSDFNAGCGAAPGLQRK